jgi:hypothetical protein
VLHNVGNVLNSMNVSAGLVVEKLRRSKVPNLGKAAALLTDKNGNLGDFLTNDPNGQKIPGYLAKLSQYLVEENAEILTEVDLLARHIEHIKEVVAVQQSYAKVSGVFEDLQPTSWSDSIAMNIGAFGAAASSSAALSPSPPVRVDRHRVLQIIINLLRNAKCASTTSSASTSALRLRCADQRKVCAFRGGQRNQHRRKILRIFGHGFTTQNGPVRSAPSGSPPGNGRRPRRLAWGCGAAPPLPSNCQSLPTLTMNIRRMKPMLQQPYPGD